MKLKWNSGEQQREFLVRWHMWFAWFPVRINEQEIIWLEKVERRLVYYGEPKKWGVNYKIRRKHYQRIEEDNNVC